MGKDWWHCKGKCDDVFNKQHNQAKWCYNCDKCYCEDCKDDVEWFEGNFCSPNCANDFKIAKVNEAKQRIENTGKIRKAEQEFVSALENFYNIKRTNQPSEYSKSFGSYIIDALKKSKCKGDLYFDIVNKYYGECYSCNRCEGCKNKRKNLLDSIE